VEEFGEDIFALCEIIVEECKRERSREEIMRMFSFMPEQMIITILDFLCQLELLKEESGKYKITEFGKKFLELPIPEGGDEFDAN